MIDPRKALWATWARTPLMGRPYETCGPCREEPVGLAFGEFLRCGRNGSRSITSSVPPAGEKDPLAGKGLSAIADTTSWGLLPGQKT